MCAPESQSCNLQDTDSSLQAPSSHPAYICPNPGNSPSGRNVSLCLFSIILSRIVCFSELDSLVFSPLTQFQAAEGLQALGLGHQGVPRGGVGVGQVPQPLLRLLAPQLLPLQQAGGKGEQVSAPLAQAEDRNVPFKPHQVPHHWLRTPGSHAPSWWGIHRV